MWRHPLDRLESVRRAHELQSEGKTITEIAYTLGVGRSTAADYINHPDTGETYRRRRRQYQRCPNEGCGRRMSYGAHQCGKCRKEGRF